MHLIYIRDCKDYVYGKGLNYGTHQIAERNISQKKYFLNDVRQGYNIPFTTQIHLLNTRIKKECLPQFARDIGGVNFNPYPNNMTLFKVFSSKRSISEKYSVGFAFKLVIWLFKWINKKKTTSTILFILGLISFQLWVWLLIPIIYFNPLKPVELSVKPSGNSYIDIYDRNWCQGYIIGCFEDPTERMQDKETNEEYTQRDVL